MKRIILALPAVIMLLSSCGSNKAVVNSSREINFMEARNYFHVGTEKRPTIKKILSRASLEKEFGEATFMGKGGEPTKIDFNKKFAIAFILPQTNRKTVLEPLSLTLKGKQLDLLYKLEQGKVQTYFTQPFFLIVVDKKYADYNIVESRSFD